MPTTSTSKRMSDQSADQVLMTIFNENDATISTSGFLDGKVGTRIKTINITATMDENQYFDEINIQTATFTTGSPVVGVTNTDLLQVGQYVFLDIGTTGITTGTRILSINYTTSEVTMTANFTGVTGPYTGHFANLLKRIRLLYDNATHDNLLEASRVE